MLLNAPLLQVSMDDSRSVSPAWIDCVWAPGSRRKARALKRFIFPAIFYGVGLSTYSKTTMSLWGPVNFGDYWLAPLLSADQIYEPFLESLERRIRAFRRFWTLQPAEVTELWNLAQSRSEQNKRAYLLEQLLVLGWEIQGDGWVNTQLGPLHIWQVDIKRWMKAALQAWSNHAVNPSRIREGIANPTTLDIVEIRDLL